jgi:hypothetical protein
MIAKVLRDRGGLHNRVTRRMQLHPFSLHETERFLSSRGIQLDRRQVLELSVAVGGIPYYRDYARKGRSAACIVFPASPTSFTPLSMRLTLLVMSSLISFAAVAERSASMRTSAATTAKPRPSSPARAASTAAFNASRLV